MLNFGEVFFILFLFFVVLFRILHLPQITTLSIDIDVPLTLKGKKLLHDSF